MPDFLGSVKGFGVTFATMFKKVDTEQYPEEQCSRPRRATTAGTCSTGTRTGWRSASAASCAPGPARPTRSTSRAADNTEEERYSPGERYGSVYQINYLRCIFCGLCIEACPTRALTMTNEYELADDNREDLIFTKEQLLAPLLPGMEAPPHPMRLGDDEKDYYRSARPASASDAARAAAARPNDSQWTPISRARDRRRAATWPCCGRRRGTTPRGGRVLDPRPIAVARGARHGPGPQRRALRAAARRRDALPGGVLPWSSAPFLGFVQIIVYTGAIMMLFLFVLMLVGVDSSDSLVETLGASGWPPAWSGSASRCCSSSASGTRVIGLGAEPA